MALSSVHGFPRIGRNRELKFATEGYWAGEVAERHGYGVPGKTIDVSTLSRSTPLAAT